MAYDEQKLLRFKESVLNDADKKIAQMKSDALKYEQTELENIKNQNYDKIFNYMQNKVRDIKWKYSRKITKKSLELKKETLVFRNELVNKLFKQCEQEIINFINSDKYKEYLLNLVKKSSSDFVCDNAKIKIRKEDLKLKEELLELPGISKVEVDDENQFGGFNLIDEKCNLMLDETIASKLDSERKYFYKTSMLTIIND